MIEKKPTVPRVVESFEVLTPMQSEVLKTSELPSESSCPTHYNFRGGIEPLEFIGSNDLNFFEGCVVKYIYRAPEKNGLEDLKKARVYLDKLIEMEESK